MTTDTNIPITTETRKRLRVYKAGDGQTYDEAINELLDLAEKRDMTPYQTGRGDSDE